MKNYLPIGTIVIIKGYERKMMIVGLSQIKAAEEIQRWDYVGVLYPVGVFSDQSFYFFNEDDINDIIFKGYENPEHKELLELLEEADDIIDENEIYVNSLNKPSENNTNAFD